MDYEAIERALATKIENIYYSFVTENPIPHFDKKGSTKAERIAHQNWLHEHNHRLREAKGRLAKVLSKVRAHQVLLRDRRNEKIAYANLVGRLVDLRVAIAGGARLLAFDVERSLPKKGFPHGELREIGYTVFQHGVMESHNLRSNTAERANWVGFSFGDTKRMDDCDIHDALMLEARKADFYVGHSLLVDINYLKHTMAQRLPVKEVFDTFDLSMLVESFGQARLEANLSTVAEHFGVSAPKPHSGGNDARYNMELLLAMVENRFLSGFGKFSWPIIFRLGVYARKCPRRCLQKVKT
jgi:hypothetical protein